MFSTYTDENKETDALLDEDISMVIDSRVQNSNTYNWKLTRRRTKEYKYVGMDETTAKACAAEKRAQYLRTFYTWTFTNGKWVKNTSPETIYKQSVANISTQRQGGSMWNVRIQVDETCIAYVVGDVNGRQINPGIAIDAACGSAGWSYDE
jgi:hypothetical protein